MSRKFSRDDIDKFFEYGLDVGNRTIYLGCATYSDDDGNGVDFYMAEKFLKAFHILEKQGPNGDRPITIIANNPGGSWYHGMAIYGAIKASKNHVTIKMFGYAMSMGSLIPQAADLRIIDPYASFMMHYGYDGYIGHSKVFSKSGDEAKRLNYMMENIYLDKMFEKEEQMKEKGVNGYLDMTLSKIMTKQKEFDYPPEKTMKYKFSTNTSKRREEVRVVLKELLNFDSFLTAEESVSLGLADKILDADD